MCEQKRNLCLKFGSYKPLLGPKKGIFIMALFSSGCNYFHIETAATCVVFFPSYIKKEKTSGNLYLPLQKLYHIYIFFNEVNYF